MVNTEVHEFREAIDQLQSNQQIQRNKIQSLNEQLRKNEQLTICEKERIINTAEKKLEASMNQINLCRKKSKHYGRARMRST